MELQFAIIHFMTNWQKIKDQTQLLDKFLVREKVIDGIRAFFKAQNFHEVETPLMVKYPGTEPFLEVFQTELKLADGRNESAFMLTSPEFAMKKLVAAGLPKIFQICKSFRNGEGLSSKHNPEFTILEWYRAEADYEEVMRDCEKLLQDLSLNLSPSQGKDFFYQGKKYDLRSPWPHISVAEAFARWVGVNTDELFEQNKLLAVAKKHGFNVSEQNTWEELYNQLFLNLIEPEIAKFNTPVIIYDYPAEQAAYSRLKRTNPRFAERFEFYVAGIELGNAFSELVDAEAQEKKFKEDLALRKKLGKTDYGLDQDYLDALKSGLPKTGGIAVGVDRLVMLLADAASIEEVTFFPASEVFPSPG